MSNSAPTRGLGWVVGQFTIIALILIVGYFDPWRTISSTINLVVGLLCGASATGLLILGFLHLGRNLTPYPKPLNDGELVTSGVYAYMRHPIYVAVIGVVVGYSLFMGSWLAGLGCVILSIWFDQKAAREEAFLRQKFPTYDVYSQSVAKFIPRLY
jgi:protein-S-isoprenylcysteine O-methyltransferase Ste14